MLAELAQIVDNLNVGVTGVGVLENQVFYNHKYGLNKPIEISWEQLSVYCEGKYVADELSNGLGGTDYYQNEMYSLAYSPHLRYIKKSDLQAVYNDIFSKNAEGIVFALDSALVSVYGDYVQVHHHGAGSFPIMIPIAHSFGDDTVTLTYTTVAIGGVEVGVGGFSDDIITLFDGNIVGSVQYDNYYDVLNGNFEYQIEPEIVADNYSSFVKIDYTFVLEDGKYKVHSIKLNSIGNADTSFDYERWISELQKTDKITLRVIHDGEEYTINPDKKGELIDWLQSLSVELDLDWENMKVFFSMPSDSWQQWNFGLGDDENFRLNYAIATNGVDFVATVNCDESYSAKVIPFDVEYFTS